MIRCAYKPVMRRTIIGLLVVAVFTTGCFGLGTFGVYEAPPAAIVAPSASTASAAEALSVVGAERCPTRLPTGYRMENGSPMTTSGRFNPHDVAVFIETVLRDATYSRAERACLGQRGATALLEHTRREGKALLFEYPFDWPYGRLGTVRAPWASGLAQGAAMTALDHLYRLDGDERWAQAAREAFEAFVAPGGVATPDGWVAEYPTSTPSYVLNGHLFAILAARFWGLAKSEVRATKLFEAGVTAAEKHLSLYEVPTPRGILSSYDLTRLNAAPSVRVSGSIALEWAGIVDDTGRVLSTPDATSLRSAAGMPPDLPVSVLATPRVFLRLTYEGSGGVEVAEGRTWTSIGSLPKAEHQRTVTVEIPARFQGRPVSLKYHRIHARLLRQLSALTGKDAFRRFADRWS